MQLGIAAGRFAADALREGVSYDIAERNAAYSETYMRLVARLSALGLILSLAACAAPDPLDEALPEMGDFRLAYNIVVADNMQQVPPSRPATPDEWEAVLTAEIERRFDSYEGDRLYHIAVNVDGYSLAPPGIPVLLAPKSILVISANIWDDARGEKLHDEPNQITVFEGTSAATVFGSGFSRNREEQMQILARNVVRQVQLWMLENPEWFNIDPEVAASGIAEVTAIAEASEAELTADTQEGPSVEAMERSAELSDEALQVIPAAVTECDPATSPVLPCPRPATPAVRSLP